MRRFARLPSRILAVSAATFIGAVGAVALATPSSADPLTASLTSEAVCGEAEGTAVVTWKVTNNDDKEVGTIRQASRTIGDLANGTKVQPQSSATGTETVDVAAGNPSYALKLRWGSAGEQELAGTADLSGLDCAPEEEPEPPKEPTATAESNCDGTLTITVKNTTEKERKFAVNGTGEFVDRKVLKVDEEWVVTVPKENSEHPRVKMEDDKGNLETFADFNWTRPDICFVAKAESSCTDLKITVENTGAKAITATLTVGDRTEDKAIEPGKAATATIDGVDGLVAKVTVKGADPESQEFTWTKTECVNVTAASGSGGGLPVTGANAGLLAGAALLLVSGGGGLFFMARRRRIRFTA